MSLRSQTICRAQIGYSPKLLTGLIGEPAASQRLMEISWEVSPTWIIPGSLNMFALGSPRNGKNLLFQKQFQIYISDLLFRVKLHFKEMLSFL